MALILKDVGAVAIEAALSGVQVAFAELEGVVLLESGVADEIGEKFVGFDLGVEVVPVFEVGFQGFFRFAGDERLARGHPVSGGV
jgi:hypothetical protein